MKKSIITLAILMAAACTSVFANGGKAPPSKPSRDYCEPKAPPSKPEPKTPEPKAPEPKAPSTPPGTASRTQSRADKPDHPCDRSWNRPAWCSVPVVDAVPAVPALPPADPTPAPSVAPLPQPVQVVTVVVHEACTQVNFAAPAAPIKGKAKSRAKAKPKAAAPVQCGVVK